MQIVFNIDKETLQGVTYGQIIRSRYNRITGIRR